MLFGRTHLQPVLGSRLRGRDDRGQEDDTSRPLADLVADLVPLHSL